MSGKGGLMRWKSDCGHWMVVHSLEPTPAMCPDCADAVRNKVVRDFDNSAPWIDIDGPCDFEDWFSESGLDQLPDELRSALGEACDQFARASALADELRDLCSSASSAALSALDKSYPRVERLAMPEAG